MARKPKQAPAVSYLRVSSKGQVEGDGFPRQRDTIARYAKSAGFLLQDEYRDEGVVNMQLYYYQVRAMDLVGNVSPNIVNVSAQPVSPTDFFTELFDAYDNDLDFDLYWTTRPAAANAFYENIDGTTFNEVAVATLTDDPLGWGISVNAGDIDNDGWMDFLVTNGFDNTTTPNVLFHNQAIGTFADATSSLSGGGAFDGRGVAFADYDKDGDLDVGVTSDSDTHTRPWRNDSITANHWIVIRLVGGPPRTRAPLARGSK